MSACVSQSLDSCLNEVVFALVKHTYFLNAVSGKEDFFFFFSTVLYLGESEFRYWIPTPAQDILGIISYKSSAVQIRLVPLY